MVCYFHLTVLKLEEKDNPLELINALRVEKIKKKKHALRHSTLRMTSAEDGETSITTNSPSQDFFHPDDQFPSRYALL